MNCDVMRALQIFNLLTVTSADWVIIRRDAIISAVKRKYQHGSTAVLRGSKKKKFN